MYVEESLHAGAGNYKIVVLFLRWKICLKRNFSRKEFILERSTNGTFTLFFFPDYASSHYIKTLPLFLIHNLVMKRVVPVLVFYVL